LQLNGYWLMVPRDGSRVRCIDAAHRIKASSFLIDGEAAVPCATCRGSTASSGSSD
jgi:hypothetical protein